MTLIRPWMVVVLHMSVIPAVSNHASPCNTYVSPCKAVIEHASRLPQHLYS